MAGRTALNAVVLALVAGALASLPARAATASSAGRAAAESSLRASLPARVAGVPSRLTWRPCGEDFPGRDCGELRLPLDYDRPRGPSLDVALIRRPADDPSRRIGSILFNPGGPGVSGVDFVGFAGDFLITPEVRARFDLIGFDPRGIARSRPLVCFRSEEQLTKAAQPSAFPLARREIRQWVRRDRRFSGFCERQAGAIIDHMSTANVVRDMDRIRRAVGDRKLSFVGYSYGSIVGAHYANLFPGKVRAVVIDGVLDPKAWATGDGNESRRLPVTARLRSEQGAYQTLQEFWRLCDAAGPGCAFSDGSPQRRYERLAARLRQAPLQLPDGSGGFLPFTYQDLVGVTLGAMYDSVQWPFLAEFLLELEQAEPAQIAASLAQLRARLAPQTDFPQTLEGRPGVVCSDTDNPTSPAAWARSARRADRQWPFFGRLWNWVSSTCASWPGIDNDRYAGPWTRHSAAPVLVVNPRFDPATSYQNAVSTSRRLARARLLTVHSWGHTSLFTSGCADQATAEYLIEGTLPPRGTVCPADVEPFAVAGADQRSASHPTKAEVGLVPPPTVLPPR